MADAPVVLPPPALNSCEYSVFISYAHADNDAWFDWITHFRNELDRGLRATLRGVQLPELHLSGENGPAAGVLGEQLERRIAASFAMIVVVHNNYAQSDWCLKELEYFRARFGERGLRERLYIVAMSEPAMLGVAGGAAWSRLLPGGQQLWLPFFEPRKRDRPIQVYIGKEVVNPDFGEQFLRLRDDLAPKLKASAAAVVMATARPAPTPGGSGSMQPAPADETAAGENAGPAAPAPPGPALGGVLIGFVPPGPSAQAASAAAERLRQRGIDATLLPQDTVFGDFAEFGAAQRLLLAFDDAPLLMGGMAPGGHLQLQRDAWLRKGKPAERIHWLDLRPLPPAAGAGEGAAGWVAAQGLHGLGVDALADSLLPRPPGAAAGAAPPQAVRIYIESNQHERQLWQALGGQIQRKWDQLARALEPQRMPPLTLRARGLPVDMIDAHPPLDDADGVVLLWGVKTADALIAQINKVENKMAPGRDAAPGIVAYLMPPQRSTEPVPAWGWQVLRFNAADAAAIDVVDEERDDLEEFLRKVLERRLQREAVTTP